MRNVARVLIAVMVVSGLLVSSIALAGADEGQVDFDLRATACLEEDLPVQADIRLKMRNLTDETKYLKVAFMNRSMTASPPSIYKPPWYSFQEFELKAHKAEFATWTVGPETLPYTTWVVKVWEDQAWVGSNLLFVENLLQIPTCGSPREQS